MLMLRWVNPGLTFTDGSDTNMNGRITDPTERDLKYFIEGYLAAYYYLRECGIQLCTDGLVEEAQAQWEKYNERSNS